MEGRPRSMRRTPLTNLAVQSSKEDMSSRVKGVCAQAREASAHSLLLVHTSSRSSICKQSNSCFSQRIMQQEIERALTSPVVHDTLYTGQRRSKGSVLREQQRSKGKRA